MASKAQRRDLGKKLTYLGVIVQVWLTLRSPLAGILLWAAHALCAAVWISGIVIFKKNLEKY